MTEPEELLSSAENFLYPNYNKPRLVLSRGLGSELWDSQGRRYIDLYAGIAVNALGHAHPRLVAAIAEQASQLIHVGNYFYTEPNIRLAEQLCELTGMARAFFCNSGTEANEAQLKLARRYFFDRGETERYRVIAFQNSFHGRTMGSLAVTGQAKYREGFGPIGGVSLLPYGDLEAVRGAMGPDVAAIIVEPIQGEGGCVVPPPEFIPGLRQLCDESGALLLVDEIQTGVGRTGRFLGIEWEQVRPDAIALAKGLGGGVPMGAMVCRAELAKTLPPGAHGTTFGGNPLVCAASLAVLEVLREEKLLEKAEKSGQLLASRLEHFVQTKSVCLSHRGRGLLRTLQLRPELDAASLVAPLREAGVLVIVAGGNSLRFAPALNIADSLLEEGLDILSLELDKRS